MDDFKADATYLIKISFALYKTEPQKIITIYFPGFPFLPPDMDAF